LSLGSWFFVVFELFLAKAHGANLSFFLALFPAQRSSKSPFSGSKKLKKPFFRLKEAQKALL
jgi:hypothetical protein